MAYQYAIATTREGLGSARLFDLNIVAPRDWYKRASEEYQGGDAHQKVRGMAVVTWHWDIIRQVPRDLLNAYYGSSLGTDLYIRTPNESRTFQDMRVAMHWPLQAEDRQNSRSLGLDIPFYVKEKFDDP